MIIEFKPKKTTINIPKKVTVNMNNKSNIDIITEHKLELEKNGTENINYDYNFEPEDVTTQMPNSPFSKLEKEINLDPNIDIFAIGVPIITDIVTGMGHVVDVQLRLEELSKSLITTALNEHNIQKHRKEYEWFSSMAWCAQYATWVYQNTEINGKSAAEIAGLTYDDMPREEWTASTGRLMMHFYTADNPDLGFDYTNEPYYKGKNSNIGFFYNDYSSIYKDKNFELGKVSNGEKYIPKPGNFIFFNHTGKDKKQIWVPNQSGRDSVQDHTGLVLDVKTDTDGNLIELTTLEGNISDSHYTRTIKFDGTDPYSEYVIGFGAIINLQ